MRRQATGGNPPDGGLPEGVLAEMAQDVDPQETAE